MDASEQAEDAHIDPRAVERVLVTCLDNLGDLVFVSALLPPLARHFERARITLWCKDYTRGIAPLVPDVDEIVSCDPFWDRAPGRRKGGILRFARTVARLRRSHFDLAIVASLQWRAAAATRATGARERIGLERRKSARWLTHVLPAADRSLPVVQENARILDALHVPHESPMRYRLERGPLEARRGELARRLALDPARPFVALHPFASKRDRCVAFAEWIAVADELERRGARCIWLGSPRELVELRALPGAARHDSSDAVTDGSLDDLAALASLASTFVGHDSGPLHVANALGVPVLGVFAPGEPLRTFPQGVARSRVLHRARPSEISAADLLRELDALAAREGAATRT